MERGVPEEQGTEPATGARSVRVFESVIAVGLRVLSALTRERGELRMTYRHSCVHSLGIRTSCGCRDTTRAVRGAYCDPPAFGRSRLHSRIDSCVSPRSLGPVMPPGVPRYPARPDGSVVGPSPEEVDLLVVGGGPAGLSAAAEAAHDGLSVVLVDERATLGGQIYRQPGPGFVVRDARRVGRDYHSGVVMVDAARRAGAELRLRTSVLSLRGTTAACLTESDGVVKLVRAGRVLVAPGATDRPVPFPGWTLPGVLTAGGAQALVKASRVAPGNRLVFAGSGPLALAFPAQLRHLGVNVVLALEAGPAPRVVPVARLLAAGWGNAALLRDFS